MENTKRIKLENEIEDPFYLKDPKLLEIYKQCLPPKESYYYFPKGEEIIIFNYEKPIKSVRRIFYNTPYTNDEQKWLNEFKQLLNSSPEIKLPDYFDDYFLLAFIYSTTGKLKESKKRIVDYLKFVNETFPIRITPNSKIIEILNKGFIYVYGRDNRYRPIIVCQCKTFAKFYKNYQTEELLQASSFLCQFIINNMMIPGKYETWNMIINAKGISILSLPEPLKLLIPKLSSYFLCRLYKNYVIGLNFFSKILYKIAVNFIDKVTAEKIKVLDEKDPELFDTIRPDNIEEQFGGTAPNVPAGVENGLFPPRMPSQKFITDSENPSNILITEEEYINKYRNGEIPETVVSPYIYEKLKLPEKIDVNNNDQEIQEKKEESINKKNKTIEPKKKKFLSKNGNNAELFRKEILNEKKKSNNYYKLKHFIYNGWNYDDEYAIPKYNFNTTHLNYRRNILNDIYTFGKKKQKFFSNISLLNVND